MIYTILALAVLLLAVVPIGTAVFVLGFIYGDSPCVLCWEQRIGMAIVALIGLFVLRYGPKPKYVGAGVLVSAWGVFMGLRHMSLHAARDVGQGFAAEIMGAHTYTWSLFIFWICVLTMALLLMLVKDRDIPATPRPLRPLESLAGVVFLVVVAGNIVQAILSTGPPPFVGQSDPVRFSFKPSTWVWSLDEWSSAPISLRGRWDIEKPAVPPADDAAKGPLANLQSLIVREHRQLGFPVNGPVTDLAYDAATDRFLVTTQNGIYIADGTLSRLIRYTVIDPGFSVDLGAFAGAAFLDSHTVMALGENKSYVTLRENDTADAGKNFRFFLESRDKFDEVSRSRLTTVRARMMYVMSVAYDPATKSVFTISVPNNKVKRFVVSRFEPDPRDPTLAEEYTPVLADGKLAFAGEKRSLSDLYVTGASFADGHLYALDAAFGTLLTIDPRSHSVVAAQLIEGLDHPAGLAVKGSDLYVAGRSGAVAVIGK